MRIPLDAGRFLARLSLWFVACFLVWLWLGPLYTRLLAVGAEVAAGVFDRPTAVWSEGTTLFFWPRGVPLPNRAPAIAAEWIQANTILLLALMAATPARSRSLKAKRFATAFGLVLAWQVFDVFLAIKFGYATQIDPPAYSERARYFYAFATNFAMYVDTQVVPFVIWAGIHFRELLARVTARTEAATVSANAPPRPRKHKRR